MNIQHLQKIQNVMEMGVKNNHISGCNCLIYKNNQEVLYLESGYKDIKNKTKFSRNTICRLFSMTKPITAVATMILVERGIIDLYQNIADFIPEFKNLTVCKNGKVEKCNRPILVKDLLNMTSGYSYGGENDESEKEISKLFYNFLNDNVANENNFSTIDLAKKLATIPVSFEPGTDYQYGLSADILGAVIEVASGMKFSDFLKKNIFEPLGMNDTDFYVPQEKQERLANVYEIENGKLNKAEYCNLGIQNKMTLKPSFESGGAGLNSTIDDYMKFCLMLVNKGILDGKRILQEKTVEFLANAKLSDNLQKCFDKKMEHWQGYTYCNLNRVCIDKGKVLALTENGEFGWDGWLGPYMSVDIKNNLVVVYLQQITNSGTTSYTRKIKNIIYSAL